MRKSLNFFIERTGSKSISPIRKVSTTPVASAPKETTKTKPKGQDSKQPRETLGQRNQNKQQEKENSYENHNKHDKHDRHDRQGEQQEHRHHDLESSVVKGLITKTNMLEDQLNTIFQVVASYMNEKIQLNEVF